MNETMKAAVFDQFGGPEAISVRRVRIPKAVSGHVVVKVIAATVNRVDTYIRAGIYSTPLDVPHVVGRDLVGTVFEVGEGIDHFSIGDLVWTNSAGYEGRPGATAEYVSVEEARLYPVPETVDPKLLIAAVHPGATAAILLDSVMNVLPNQRLLIEGAAGHVGRALLALSTMRGVAVTTTSAPRDFERLKELGATNTLDYHSSLPKNQLNYFDHVIDTSGRASLQENLDALREGGEITLITAPSSDHFDFTVRPFYMNQKHINGFVLSRASEQQLYEAAATINEAFAAGRLLDSDVLLMPIEEVAEAHRMIESGAVGRRRLLLIP